MQKGMDLKLFYYLELRNSFRWRCKYGGWPHSMYNLILTSVLQRELAGVARLIIHDNLKKISRISPLLTITNVLLHNKLLFGPSMS